MKVKTMFARKPKVIRSNRGVEYIGNRIIEMLKSEGIRMQYTAPYTPQKNNRNGTEKPDAYQDGEMHVS